jgi:putative hydrolase
MTDVASMLAEDHHVHSTYSDDATSPLADNVAAARIRGLHTMCLSEHVRADTTWLAEYARAARSAADRAELVVLCAVEAKMLDSSGRLDLPDELPALDRVLIADHQYPGRDGPVSPGEIRRRLAGGELAAGHVVETIVLATARAMRRVHSGQLAHLFSVLPKLGLTEDDVGTDELRLLAETARETGTVLEVNEKWRCPGPAALAEFMAAGVTVVPSSDSHRAEDIGAFRRVPALVAGGNALGTHR